MTRAQGRIWWRVPTCLLGLGGLGFGAEQLLSGGPATAPPSSLSWLAGVLIVHDGLLAPAAVLAGWVLHRLTRNRREVARVVGGGLLVAACLVVVGLPPLLTPGVADNATATPRDYRAGLLLLLAADGIATAALAGAARRGARRRRRG